MKFGAEYQAALGKGEYPPQWINSSISYKKLKKCIKRIRQELSSLGLDHETLNALWQHIGTHASTSGDYDSKRLMQYQFTTEDGQRFVPRLCIALDPEDGSPMDAWLAPETKKILQRVGRRHSSIATTAGRPNGDLTRSISFGSEQSDTLAERTKNHDDIETIEVPLTSDSEFFQILRKELQDLEDLQVREQKGLTQHIESLASDLEAVKLRANKKKPSKDAKREIDTWREIFRLYIESEIFVSDHESDAGVRSADKAAQQLTYFAKQLAQRPSQAKPKSAEAHIALERFMSINTTLLRLLKFQELNRRALGKILKKFDKQTSLNSNNTISSDPTQLLSTLSPHQNNNKLLSTATLARATASTISTSLLTLIPQLDDYLCPICMSITYRPIRLRCNHVFCIRCMIRLQRDSKDECPMCRERGVLEATENNLDKDLQKFLKQEFKGEVAEKKRENDLLAGKELFGEGYEGTHKCVVM
ncbi:hypothetical protein H2198_000900 [Neophaeococcomyces mojaviensis]|uniref:Uncharacterized protein n=1 Tax=Neophaeococcomyces mojaviensis TaxID=3383035 RepID=A0ACC3AJ95_9EURO|nr:hypothetical protein H2198_000900 [Knufia sp. JES_112]